MANFMTTVMCTMYITKVAMKRHIHSSSPGLEPWTCLLFMLSVLSNRRNVAVAVTNSERNFLKLEANFLYERFSA